VGSGPSGTIASRLACPFRQPERPKESRYWRVSATSTTVIVQEAYDAGCDGYITKPVDIGTFASTVRQYANTLKD
jgi:DNA-binding NarL/FixJ family response regulator